MKLRRQLIQGVVDEADGPVLRQRVGLQLPDQFHTLSIWLKLTIRMWFFAVISIMPFSLLDRVSGWFRRSRKSGSRGTDSEDHRRHADQ